MVFHQLFEGFSLGIRIAAIPAKAKRAEEGSASEGTLAVEEVLLDPSTGDLEAASNKVQRSKSSTGEAHWLKSTLSFLFGVTTPAGMALGMTLWPSNVPGHGGGTFHLDICIIYVFSLLLQRKPCLYRASCPPSPPGC